MSSLIGLQNALLLVGTVAVTSLAFGIVGMTLSIVNEGSGGTSDFVALNRFSSPLNPVEVYTVVCENLTIGNETLMFSETTEFYTTCGEPPNECSQFVCTEDHRCEVVNLNNTQCSVSTDCPGYLDGEICDLSSCSCVPVNIDSGGPTVLVREAIGNIDPIVGFRLRNFGSTVQGVFLQLANQTVAEWPKFNYNWGSSSTHSVVANYDFSSKIFTLNVVAEDSPSTNLEVVADISDLVGDDPIDSFQFISVARSGQFLIYDNVQFSSLMTSPATYRGTPTFVDHYFVNSTSGEQDFTHTSTVYLSGAYSGQETTKVEVAFGRGLSLAAPLVLSDFFVETEDFPPTNGTEAAMPPTGMDTSPSSTEFATSPPTDSVPTDLPTALPTDIPPPTDFATSPPPSSTFPTDLPTALPTDFPSGTGP